MPESKQKSDVETQTSPFKETSPQVSVSRTEPLLEIPDQLEMRMPLGTLQVDS